MNDFPASEDRISVARLSRDLAASGRLLTHGEARFLVDAYYQMQKDRIRADHQARTLSEGSEPASLLIWLGDQRELLEKQVGRSLDQYSDAHPVGQWMRSIHGIGPIISAGMLAHIDITKAPTCGHIWRYAGLDPTTKWTKGQKRPWNGELKRLCWIVGESFTKVSGKEGEAAFYAHDYKARKTQEMAANEAGAYAEQAAASLKEKRFDRDTETRKAYEAGKLPQARIHLRAQRHAVKLFLSDLHAVWYWHHYGTIAPFPWVISHGGHVHFRVPVHVERFPGLLEAYQARGPVILPSQL